MILEKKKRGTFLYRCGERKLVCFFSFARLGGGRCVGLILYAVLMIDVLEHALEVALDEGHCQRGDQAERHDVEERRLRMLEHMHDKYGAEQGQYVGDERRVKVNFTVTIQTFLK